MTEGGAFKWIIINSFVSPAVYYSFFFTPSQSFVEKKRQKRKDFQRFRSVLSLITAHSDQSDQWYTLFDMKIMTSHRPELQQWGRERSKRWSITVKINRSNVPKWTGFPTKEKINKTHFFCSLLLKINIAFNYYNYLLQNYNGNVLFRSLENLASFEDQIRKKHTSLSYPSQHLWKTLWTNLCYNKYGGVWNGLNNFFYKPLISTWSSLLMFLTNYFSPWFLYQKYTQKSIFQNSLY